jgi:hypothetical protein
LPRNGVWKSPIDGNVGGRIIRRMKIDRGISYGMARKIFKEKMQALKKTYAEIAGKFIDDLVKDEANELKTIEEKRLNTEQILQKEEEENTKLNAT